jgi:exodeoxyribonuclease V beta subunit
VSFIVIGDPKQSIYRFRGADLASYKRLAANAHPASPMRCNYRSDKPLIDSLNNLYTSSYVFPDALTSHSKTAYIPVRSQHDSRIQDSKNLPAMIFQWSEQSSRRAAQQEIAEMVAHECSRLISEGVHVEDRHSGHMRPLRFGDIAVLCYGHHELKIVRRALTHLGISCHSSGAGLGSVFESPEADDVHAWLQLLSAINSHGSVLGKLLAFEGTPLGCSETNRFQSNGNGPSEQAAQLAVFQREAEIMQRFGPLPSMLKRLDQRGVIKRNLGYAEGERRYTNWRHLASLLQLEHARGRRGPQALGQWLARNIAGGDRTGSIETGASNSVLMKLETDSSAVQMVTVHGSKGLEYPVVFCPFLWQLRSKKERLRKQTALLRMTNEWCVDVGSAKFVEHLNKGIEQEDEEEHRKLYVALTRARHRLYIGMAPVTESGTNQNGAARSPIAALPGLNLANTELSLWRQALEQIEGCAVHDRTGLSVASSRLAKQHGTHAWDDPHTLKPPQELRPYAFLIKRTASFTSLSKSEQDCEGAADRDFEKAEPKLISGPDLLSELGQAGAALGDRLHAVLEDYLGNRADMSEAVAECNPPDAWKNAIETIVRTPLSFGAHEPISLDEVREGCITEMQFHLPILTLNPKTLSSALLEDPRIRADKERSQWANQISENWPFSEFGGYLQGYIDLIFEHENRWFLVDYKSNKLDDYTPATLESMMLEKHYLLQARLYALALHRHLQVQMPGYNHSEHFGGVGYLFVRGLPVEGLWFDRPCLESLQSLGTLFTFNQK